MPGVRCELRRQDVLIGHVGVVDGQAVPSTDEVARLVGLCAGCLPLRVAYGGKMRVPADGEDYVRGLPGAFRSGYVNANLVA